MNNLQLIKKRVFYHDVPQLNNLERKLGIFQKLMKITVNQELWLYI